MSKVFETLSKGEGELAKLILPLVDEPQEPPLRETARKEPSKPAVAASAPIPAGRAREDSPGEVRTLSLHVPAPSPLLPFEDSQWRASEQYRILRTKIVQHPRQPRMIVISSPAPGDGKSVTAINLAATLSLKSAARVLLVDADFRKSAIHVQLGLPETPGLADVLKGACSPEEALVNARELANLYVMPAGTPPPNPVELLDSALWQAVCSKFRGLFRYVILDSPPVAAVADYDLIQAPCDGVVLVVRPDHTQRPLLRKSLDIVAKDRFLGVLLNCVPEGFLAKDRYADYSYYSMGSRQSDRDSVTAQPQ